MSDLSVSEVSRRFGEVPALNQATLHVRSGTLTAVLGPSGCGKTTLLRTIAGITDVDSGTIRLGATVLVGDRVRIASERRGVGLVPQDSALFPHLDVAQNIAFGLRGMGPTARRKRVDELLGLVGLSGLARRRPDELSGGQQQRVALARALAPQPGVILLDEPFSALDASLRQDIRREITDVLRALGATALLVTHDQTEALAVADRVALMKQGTIIQEGTPREIYNRPTSAWAAKFVGEALLLPGVRSDRRVQTALGTLPLAPGDHAPGPEVMVCLRPEQVVRQAAGQRATVTDVRFLGPDGTVDLLAADDTLRRDGQQTMITARWPAHQLPEIGDQVAIGIAGKAVAFPRSASADEQAPASATVVPQ